jgi:hypothetical protein
VGGSWFKASSGKNQGQLGQKTHKSYIKGIKAKKKDEGMALVIEHLPSKCKVLSSNSISVRKKLNIILHP